MFRKQVAKMNVREALYTGRKMLLSILKTTLRFKELLEGLTEFRKAVILTVTVDYSKRIQIIRLIIAKGYRL